MVQTFPEGPFEGLLSNKLTLQMRKLRPRLATRLAQDPNCYCNWRSKFYVVYSQIYLTCQNLDFKCLWCLSQKTSFSSQGHGVPSIEFSVEQLCYKRNCMLESENLVQISALPEDLCILGQSLLLHECQFLPLHFGLRIPQIQVLL